MVSNVLISAFRSIASAELLKGTTTGAVDRGSCGGFFAGVAFWNGRPTQAARLPRAICFCLSNSARRRASSSGLTARCCCSRASSWHPRSSVTATAPWFARRLPIEQAERQFERLSLRYCVMWLAGGIAEWEVAEQKAWRRGVLDDVLGASHHDGRDAVGLEMARHEGRGLVADRAVRHDHRNIDLVGNAACQNFGGVNVDGNAMATVGGRAEEARCDFPDAARSLRLQKLRQRKPGVAVGRGGVLAIIADMRDP